MIDKFFGVHPYVVTHFFSKMKPGAIGLYMYLMKESERCCTREMKRTDAQINEEVGVAARTLCNARKKLQEFGLIRCTKGEGNKYIYAICNPMTGEPYPGGPREPLTCSKRGRKTESLSVEQQKDGVPTVDAAIRYNENVSLQQHGLSGVFDP